AILPAVIYTNLITLALVTVATVFVVLYVSHKIAGPLFRFEKELAEIAEGDLTKVIHLRRKDEVTDMADSLNRMTASLRERLEELQGELDEAAAIAREENASDRLVEKLKDAQTTVHGRFKV
ncbi:MAG: HAMP domain-containing protein, partial [Deltaproteobacteria bacterium]|nr:HAMP domain-containing protein [Deltaproteobacteria bacterium]